MAVKQVYNNFFIGPLVEMSATTMNEGCVYLASDTQEMYGVDASLNLFIIGGEGSEDKNFVYFQNTPSAIWEINHPLGKLPSVSVISDANEVMEGEVIYVDDYNVTLKFVGPFTGKATLN